jgi:replication factor C subunit 2/4
MVRTGKKTKNVTESKDTRNAPLPRDMPKMQDIQKMFDSTDILSYNPGQIVQHTGLSSVNSSIWVDKYRPKTLDDVIGHDDIKNVIKNSIHAGDLPHLLFYGPPGTGKTSITHATVHKLYGSNVNGNVLELNASDENGINVVRDKIIKFANLEASRSEYVDNAPTFKVIILDEADSMTIEAQTALKKAMEKTCKITRFIIICNYEKKILPAIISRCAGFRFNPIPRGEMINKLRDIAEKEKMMINDAEIYANITDICEGDARRSINTLQNLKYIPDLLRKKIPSMHSFEKYIPENIREDVIAYFNTDDSNLDEHKRDASITIHDVNIITSSIDYAYFDRYWKMIKKCPDIGDLNHIVHSIVIEGYPMDCVLRYFNDKIMESNLIDVNKADVLLFIGTVEKMLVNGSGNHIQTLALLTLIVSKFENVKIKVPLIF